MRVIFNITFYYVVAILLCSFTDSLSENVIMN